MLIRSADLLDLAQAFPVPASRRPSAWVAEGPIFLLVRGSMLEAHRGPMHARVPLCVWARDRVIGWVVWKALPDPQHAPETLDVEQTFVCVDAQPTPVQTRAVFQHRRTDRRGYVDAYMIAGTHPMQPLDVPPAGVRIVCRGLDLSWAAREALDGSRLGSHGVARANLILRADVEHHGRALPAAAKRLLGDSPHRGTIQIPPAWLDDPVRALPHRDGLALIGPSWWATFGYNFEPLEES